ncbi:hypothetical protein Esti_002508 [Eimeria stiedai]
MFFSSAKKAAESSAVNDAAAAGESPTKRGGTSLLSGAPNGILHVLLFNPTLKPEGASTRDAQAECSPSKASAASTFEAEEGEGEELSWEEKEQEAKLVFSYPLNREPEERRSQAGLLEGLLMFTKPFSPHEAPLRSISTEKYIIVLEEVEPNYWLAITSAANALFSGAGPSLNEGEQERINEDTQEDILLGVLRCMYATFRLLHSRIGSFLEGGRRQELEDVLRDFCPAFIDSLDLRRLSVFHAISGYHFAPVDRLPYLCVPSLVSVLQQNYSCIQHAALLLSGCLVYHSMNTPLDEGPLVGPRVWGPSYSGLSFDGDTLAVLYNYLVCSEGSAAVDMHKLLKPPFGRVPTAAARRGGGCSSFGRAITEEGAARFIFGPVGQFAFLPSVHFADDSSGSLLAIVHEQLLFLLVLDETDRRISDVSFLQSIRSAAVDGPCGLRELNAVLASEFRKVMKQEDTYRFIYFNHANRAIRISNRQCLPNAPSPPYFKNFCLSLQEVQRMSHMHCKFLGLAQGAESGVAASPYTPLTSPTAAGGDACKEASAKSPTAKSPVPAEDQAETHQPSRPTAAAGTKERGGQQALRLLRGVRTIAVKDAQSGWMVGKRTCDREHFLALDDPKTTFSKAMEDANRFSSLHFSNIFV